MAATVVRCVRHFFTQTQSLTNSIRSLSTSCSVWAGHDWRESRGLPGNWTERGPITDSPDWCYSDGRPGHLTFRQKRRVVKQMEYAKKIELLVSEVDFAVENHARKMKEKEDLYQRELQSQPKPKVTRRHLKKSTRLNKEPEE